MSVILSCQVMEEGLLKEDPAISIVEKEAKEDKGESRDDSKREAVVE